MTDASGTETKGTVLAVSTTDLTLDVNGVQRQMDFQSVRQVQRYGDSLWNGFLIGAAIGIPAVLISDPRYEACKGDPGRLCANAQIGQRVLLLGMTVGGGVALDALFRSRHLVYLAADHGTSSTRRVTVIPQFSPSVVGVLVTLDLDATVHH